MQAADYGKKKESSHSEEQTIFFINRAAKVVRLKTTKIVPDFYISRDFVEAALRALYRLTHNDHRPPLKQCWNPDFETAT